MIAIRIINRIVETTHALSLSPSPFELLNKTTTSIFISFIHSTIMEITLTTPALLFPAISLLLLAYTNRFLALASLIRNLHSQNEKDPSKILIEQIRQLRKRVLLIRSMQFFGVSSLLLCVVCMFVLFTGNLLIGKWIFGISLCFLIISLTLSVVEVQVSVRALNIQLGRMGKGKTK